MSREFTFEIVEDEHDQPYYVVFDPDGYAVASVPVFTNNAPVITRIICDALERESACFMSA